MGYKLYLDDERLPKQSFPYMIKRIGEKNALLYMEEWVIVKHYGAFVSYIEEHGLPDLISFDHDLADAHYGIDLASEDDWNKYYNSERCNKNYFKTGYHCAQWLLEYCEKHKLALPPYMVHSMNPVGTANIKALLK